MVPGDPEIAREINETVNYSLIRSGMEIPAAEQ
jgi:hypothetical protein